MARLSKQQVLDAPLKTKEIEVAALGGSILIGEMSVAKRSALLSQFVTADGKAAPVSAALELDIFIAGCVDPEFTQKDAAALQKISGAAVGDVAKEIMALNGLGGDGADEARGNS